MRGVIASVSFRWGGKRRSRHILLSFFSSVQRRDDAHFVVIFAIAYLACICWSKVGVYLEYQAVLGLEFRKLFISFA